MQIIFFLFASSLSPIKSNSSLIREAYTTVISTIYNNIHFSFSPNVLGIYEVSPCEIWASESEPHIFLLSDEGQGAKQRRVSAVAYVAPRHSCSPNHRFERIFLTISFSSGTLFFTMSHIISKSTPKYA